MVTQKMMEAALQFPVLDQQQRLQPAQKLLSDVRAALQKVESEIASMDAVLRRRREAAAIGAAGAVDPEAALRGIPQDASPEQLAALSRRREDLRIAETEAFGRLQRARRALHAEMVPQIYAQLLPSARRLLSAVETLVATDGDTWRLFSEAEQCGWSVISQFAIFGFGFASPHDANDYSVAPWLEAARANLKQMEEFCSQQQRKVA